MKSKLTVFTFLTYVPVLMVNNSPIDPPMKQLSVFADINAILFFSPSKFTSYSDLDQLAVLRMR